jgi:GT2 family glycosyltransferase
MSPAAFSIILPNYNGRHLLQRNLPSLFRALEDFEHEVIVVDDCSSDDSVSFLQQHYPQVLIVQNPQNLGFSATCNRGIATASKPLLCIVNTDVTFTPEYFTSALPHFDDPALFSVKGAIVNYRDVFTDVINTEATSELYYSRGFLRFNQRVVPDIDNLTGAIGAQFTLLGCCFICRREMMQQLNGFDEIYSPFYWEDADLAFRALRHGYLMAYEPLSIVYHQINSTIGNYRSKTKLRLVSMRNKFIFTWHHLQGASNWIQHIGFTLLSLLGRWLILDWKYYIAFIWAVARSLKYGTTTV